MKNPYPKIARLKSVDELRQHLATLSSPLPMDDEILTAAAGSPLAQGLSVGDKRIANRWCIHPMEGWDANPDGSPSERTLRRWSHFGQSGAALIWGGEAAAVQPAGRANPHQTLAVASNKLGLAALRDACLNAHRNRYDSTDGLLLGLQLTHSGRFCKPNSHDRAEPRIAYHHPLLDAKFKIAADDASVVITDDELLKLIDDYVVAAKLAAEIGFDFVDIKACHGYLLHELLSARHRSGRFGGDLTGRSRVLLEIIERVRSDLPHLMIGVRLSVFDSVPYITSTELGRPMAFEDLLPYEYGFGVDPTNPLQPQLDEPLQLLRRLQSAGVAMINVTGGSPYYNPHIQRPAIFPPSDGYQPPEDPLIGVYRQMSIVRQCKQSLPDLLLVGSGYSYLQDFLPHVAQAAVRDGWVDFVGLGRMVLSYPDLPHDVLTTGQTQRKKVCRTFSDCTTAPRHGLVSGCYPLDDYYKSLPENRELAAIKDTSKTR